MTKEQLDALVEFIQAAIDLRVAEIKTEYRVRSRKSQGGYLAALDALYATIETHTELEELPDAELFGQTEGVAK